MLECTLQRRRRGIHILCVVVVRMYEDIKFISKPKGVRMVTENLKGFIYVLALRGEVLQNGLKKKAIKIIKLCS